LKDLSQDEDIKNKEIKFSEKEEVKTYEKIVETKTEDQ
jgi:hypothetical protein